MTSLVATVVLEVSPVVLGKTNGPETKPFLSWRMLVDGEA